MRRSCHSLLCLTLVLLGASCKEDQAVTPEDPVPTLQLTVNDSTVRHVDPVSFSVTISGAVVDSIVIVYGDGQGDRRAGGGNTQFVFIHTYSIAATYTATAIAYARSKQAQKSLQIAVSDGSPVVNTTQRSFNEGDSLSVPQAQLVTDPDGDPFTVEYASSDPKLVVSPSGTSVNLKGSDGDVSGTFNLVLSVTYLQDGQQKLVEGTVPVVINPMDVVEGFVKDYMDGTYLGNLEPELVASAPWAKGWVKVDGALVPLDLATGFFKTGKVPAQEHKIERGGFVTTDGDTAFGAYDLVPAGDRVIDREARIHTPKGTGMNRADFYEYLWSVNFLKSINSSDLRFLCADYSIPQYDYLSAQDATLNGIGGYKKMTVANMDQIEGSISPKLYAKLPPEFRPTLVRGSPTDSLPVRIGPVNGEGEYTLPRQGWSLAFIKNAGSGFIEPILKGYTIAGAYVTFLPALYGFEESAVLQEYLSKYAAPGQGLRQEKFNFKSCLHEFYSTDYLTGADLLLLYYPTFHAPGAKVSQYWIMN